MMSKDCMTTHVKLDAAAFRKFAIFDNLLLRRRWTRPIIFFLILTAFSVVCFLLKKEQSALIGTVLFLVAVLMPLTYFGTFFYQIHTQIKTLKLKTPQAFYTLRFSPEGIQIENDRKKEETQNLPWDKVYAVYRVAGFIYLYATPTRAFLLPDGQTDATPAEMWDLFERHIDKKRLFAKK